MKRQTRNLSHLALCTMKKDILDMSIFLLVSKGKAGALWKNPHPGWSSSSRRYAQLLSLIGKVEEDLRTERYEMNEPGKTCGWTTSESSRTPSSMLPLL